MVKSRYVLLISGLSKYTRSSDIRYECERYGTVMSVERDVRERQALVEFKRSSAAADAYDDLEGIVIDDRKWRVDWANEGDFKFFNWSWFEGRGEDEFDKGRGGGGGGKGGSSRNPSPSLSSEKHGGGGGSPVRENDESKDRFYD